MKNKYINVYGIDKDSIKDNYGIRKIRLCGSYHTIEDAEQAITELSK